MSDNEIKERRERDVDSGKDKTFEKCSTIENIRDQLILFTQVGSTIPPKLTSLFLETWLKVTEGGLMGGRGWTKSRNRDF